MIVYRVYEPFHSSSESGTNEYGIFSTVEGAQAHVADIWEANGYPDNPTKNANGWSASGPWETFSIRIVRVVLDEKKRNSTCIGYT